MLHGIMAQADFDRNLQADQSLVDRNLYAWLNAIARDGGTLSTLVEALSTIVQRSVIIEDSSLRTVAQVLMDPIDDLRKASVINTRSAPLISRRLLRTGLYNQIKQDLRPVVVAPIPSLGMTYERLVAPIVVSQDIFGYIWVITEGIDAESIFPAIEQAALIAALIMLKERIDQEQATSLRQIFMRELTKPQVHEMDVLDIAKRVGIRSDETHRVLVIDGPPEAGGNARPLFRDVSEWLSQEFRQPPFSVFHDERVVVILGEKTAEEVAENIIGTLVHPARHLIVGVSPPCDSLVTLAAGYRQAVEAIQITQRMGRKEGVVKFSELGLLHWLYHIPPDAITGNPYLAQIGELSLHDGKRRTELVKTLEAFLDNGNNLVDTAQILHIHRNTLVHRLRRIEELSGIDLRNPAERLNLHVAVKQFRLLNSS